MPNDADSIYRAPTSDVDGITPREGDFGSVSRALAGDFSFRIGEVMSEAWQLTSGSKGVLVGGAVALYALTLVLTMGTALLTVSPDGGGPGALGLVLQQIASFVPYPIFAGMLLYAIKRAAHDHTATFADVFSPYGQVLSLLGLYVLQAVLVILGFLLLVLPGIYLAVAYWMAVPLLVERGLGIWESLETSRKVISKVWFQFFGLMLLVGLAVILGAIVTLGIGLIWLGPWGVLCIGVAYRKIFGYGPESA